MRNSILLMTTCVGCTHLIGSSEPDNGNKANLITFPSGATVSLPEGVTCQQDDNLLQFSIDDEPLELHLGEYRRSIDAAIMETKKSLYPDLLKQKPVQEMDRPEVGWDETKIEIFGPDSQEKYLQLVGKRKDDHTWVMTIKASQGVLEKRSAQIMTLLGSLKPTGQKSTDFSDRNPVSIDKRRNEFSQFIEGAMADARVPGLSIAIVEDGEVSYVQSFGKRGIEDKNPVDPNTRFMIGSTSKSLTTLMISKLVDKGIVRWSDRVVDLYPDFALKDSEFSSKLTLKDLACACTGVPRRDIPMIFNHAGKGADVLLDELRFLEPTTDYKETFQYNNQLVAASGFIASLKAKPELSYDNAYHELMKRYVFEPIGMGRTTSNIEAAVNDANVSQSHGIDWDGNLKVIDLAHEKFAQYVSPSGGIWSTAKDMANYMITEINRGKFKGQSIVSEEGVLARREKQVQINENYHYGLGWMVGKNMGLDVVQHGGSTLGFSSEFVFFPGLKRGIVTLSNSSYGGLVHGAIFNKVLEIWFKEDLKAKELLASNLKMAQQGQDHLRSNSFEVENEFIHPYLGKHYHPEIGELEILKINGQYRLRHKSSQFDLIGFKDNSGSKKIMTSSSPLIGVMIDPVFSNGISIKIARGQEVYEFKPVGKSS